MLAERATDVSRHGDRRGTRQSVSAAAATRRPRASWSPPPAFPRLADQDVHAWLAPLEGGPQRARGLAAALSEDERARANRFLTERDRRRFIVCRGVLRTILGWYLGVAPAAVEFRYGPHGKPAITGGPGRCALRFNVSHADGMALYAVTLGREVGVDLERVRSDVATEEIAERFFSAREAAVLRALDPASRVQAFFRIWTRKEAYLKATGRGLLSPLRELDVSFLPDEPAALLATPLGPREACRWRLEELFADARYVAAIAVEGHGWRLRRWKWPAHLGEAAYERGASSCR